MIQPGTRVRTSGYSGVVIGNSEVSYTGHCPDGMVVVRLSSGVCVVSVCDVELDYTTELTPEGEQAVIPGCERNQSPTGLKQGELFG